MEKNRTDPGRDRWFIPEIKPGFPLPTTSITIGEVCSIFLMQRWGLLFIPAPFSCHQIWNKPDDVRFSCVKRQSSHGGDVAMDIENGKVV